MIHGNSRCRIIAGNHRLLPLLENAIPPLFIRRCYTPFRNVAIPNAASPHF